DRDCRAVREPFGPYALQGLEVARAVVRTALLRQRRRGERERRRGDQKHDAAHDGLLAGRGGIVPRAPGAGKWPRVTVGWWDRTSSAGAGEPGVLLPTPRLKGPYLGLALLIAAETTRRGEPPLPLVDAGEQPGPAHTLARALECLLDPFAFPD